MKPFSEEMSKYFVIEIEFRGISLSLVTVLKNLGKMVHDEAATFCSTSQTHAPIRYDIIMIATVSLSCFPYDVISPRNQVFGAFLFPPAKNADLRLQ
jgi:hypothetical protein